MTFDQTVPATSRESAARPELPELPHLFLVLECQRPAAAGMRFALDGLESITIGRGAGRPRTLEAGSLRVDVPDGRTSSRHAMIRRNGDGYVVDDHELRRD